MEQYTVTGMSCAACQARVEKAVSAVPGVTSCSVSLLTNSLGVEGTAPAGEIIRAVENAGYGASLRGADSARTPSDRLKEEEEALRDRETPMLKKRLALSLGFLAVLMYVSMGHMMFSWPLPAFFEGNCASVGLLELLLCAAVMIVNRRFFTSGFKSLWHRSPNMDSLIALGSAAGFIYSTVILFLITRRVSDGDHTGAMALMEEFYFESSAMILALITVGKMLEARAKGRTTDALKSLMKLSPRTAVLLRDGKEVAVPVSEVRTGDLFAVRPGEQIPVDGVVTEGFGAVNESALTGESVPADKTPGSTVSAATLNQTGYLVCRATRVGEDTALSQIIRMVSDAAATKAPVAKLADRISAVFVPAVIGVSLVTFAVWMLLRGEVGFALARAITVLVVSCPCALGLATPVAIMVGSGVGARNGILFKTAAALQETGSIGICVLDKTGTVTSGEMTASDLLPVPGVTEEELIRTAYALEQRSEHPLARAVCALAEKRGLTAEAASDFEALPGSGIRAVLGGKTALAGSVSFISSRVPLPEEVKAAAEKMADEGRTPLAFASGGRLLGLIAAADTIRSDSADAIRQMKNMGIHTVMLTGDNARTARAVGKAAGTDEVIAGVLPGDKARVVEKLKRFGKVAMVGDGINDAPALTTADIGIAIGAGTDVAIDAADVVVMKSNLTDVAAAVRLSRAAYKNVRENLFWALVYNCLLIPAAAGVYASLGITMNPMLGAAAMSLSSFCVVTNALRLNFKKIRDPSRDRHVLHASVPENGQFLPEWGEHNGKEGKNMTKTLKIQGMMCMHCEATVKKALEKLDGVENAEVSHEKGTAVVTLSAPVDDAVLTRAVEDRDYTVTGIE